jgi:riboflavin kinase / FMN adenylyltransferase
MRIVRSLDAYRADADLLLTIGVFDGVHVGHRSVLARLAAQRAAGPIAGAFTFEQHPHDFLHPGTHQKVLTTIDEKINLLDACGLDVLFLVPFDERIQSLSAETFLQSILLERLRVRMLIVGENWRFGKDRAGDVALAKRILEAAGCRFEAESLLMQDSERVSSSRIRSLIERREFAEADALLGSPFTVRGVVVLGDGRGHELGFPTANLSIPPEKLIPPHGVYRAMAHFDGRDRPAVVSIGDKPTFGGSETAVEVYLPGFSGSIYGECIALRDWRFIREQRKFENAAALIEQMKKDVTGL